MLLELHNVKKYFPVKKNFLYQTQEYVKAVDEVSLNIEEGESFALVGESGSGKTTLGRIILRLMHQDGGKVIFNGNDISQFSLIRKNIQMRQAIQMVFQDPYSSLDPRFTVRRIILEAMVLGRLKTPLQKENIIKKLLLDAQLPENILERYPHEFSGGERQRIAIARALATQPKLLILDEATSSLDVLIQEQILELLKRLQSKFNLTYLFISHNLRIVRKISDKIAVMYKGKIVETGSTKEIFQNPVHPYTKRLLSAALNYEVEENIED